MSANEVLALEPTVSAWADIVIKEWHGKAEMLGIHAGQLLRSFTHHVFWAAAGDLNKISFVFEHYGKFVDMGIGKGVSLDTRDTKISLGTTSRRPKPWFTDTFYKELAILRYKLSERLADNVQLLLVRSLAESSGDTSVAL